MIKTESLTINGRAFTKTYSDSDRYVVRDEIEYSEAIDPSEFSRTYIEGEPIEYGENEAEELLNILIGGTE